MIFHKKNIIKKIIWSPASIESWKKIPTPSPSKKYIAEWYKNIPLFSSDKKIIFNKDGSWQSNATLKKCIPFLDVMISGYVQELWTDVYIDTTGEKILCDFNSSIPPVLIRDPPYYLPKNDIWEETEFAWNTQWEPRTDLGYSCIYLHPSNRFDLPFITCSGVIDTDSWNVPGLLPFMIKKNFRGIIKKGTPMYQVIPFKREDWLADSTDNPEKSINEVNDKLKKIKKIPIDGYRDTVWKKKKYE